MASPVLASSGGAGASTLTPKVTRSDTVTLPARSTASASRVHSPVAKPSLGNTKGAALSPRSNRISSPSTMRSTTFSVPQPTSSASTSIGSSTPEDLPL